MNQQISLTLSLALLILFLLSGCEAWLEDELPGTMTVKVKVTSLQPLNADKGGHLDLIYTDVTGTQHKFFVTQDFEQTFQLDTSGSRVYGKVELSNITPHTFSVRLTLLLDGEIEYDKSVSEFTTGSRLSYGFEEVSI